MEDCKRKKRKKKSVLSKVNQIKSCCWPWLWLSLSRSKLLAESCTDWSIVTSGDYDHIRKKITGSKGMLLRWWFFFFFTVLTSQESFNKHITKVLWKQSEKSSHKMPSIFLDQFSNSMMYSIDKKFCFININSTLKLMPEKWKLEVSIKSRTNSNLQAILRRCHQMRLLQALV